MHTHQVNVGHDRYNGPSLEFLTDKKCVYILAQFKTHMHTFFQKRTVDTRFLEDAILHCQKLDS